MLDTHRECWTPTVPTLVVAGEHDTVVPLESARALQERTPAAALAVIDGAGHMVANEQPAAFTQALLTFLARLG